MKKLFEFLKSTRGKPFEWGVNDCCTLASGALIAQGLDDPMKEFRGEYSTERGAKLALKKHGFNSIKEAVDSKLERCEKAYIETGSPVLLNTGNMGVKTPYGVWAITEIGGVELTPSLNEIEAAWSI